MEEPVRQPDPHHEIGNRFAFTAGTAQSSGAVPLGIDAPPAKISLEPRLGNSIVPRARECANLFQALPGILLAFEALYALCFGLRLGYCLCAHGNLPI